MPEPPGKDLENGSFFRYNTIEDHDGIEDVPGFRQKQAKFAARLPHHYGPLYSFGSRRRGDGQNILIGQPTPGCRSREFPRPFGELPQEIQGHPPGGKRGWNGNLPLGGVFGQQRQQPFHSG